MAKLKEDERGAYHRVLLLVSVCLMALPWAVSEYDGGTFFAPFQVVDHIAGFGVVFFLLGALVYRESEVLGAAVQSVGLLAFNGGEHIDVYGAYWIAVIYIACVWVLIIVPDLPSRIADRMERDEGAVEEERPRKVETPVDDESLMIRRWR